MWVLLRRVQESSCFVQRIYWPLRRGRQRLSISRYTSGYYQPRLLLASFLVKLILALSSSSFSAGVWQQKPSFQARSSFLCVSLLLSWLVCPLICFYSPVKVSVDLRAELFPKQPWGSFLLLSVWKLSAHLFFLNASWFLWILPVPVPLNPALWKDLEFYSK